MPLSLSSQGTALRQPLLSAVGFGELSCPGVGVFRRLDRQGKLNSSIDKQGGRASRLSATERDSVDGRRSHAGLRVVPGWADVYLFN